MRAESIAYEVMHAHRCPEHPCLATGRIFRSGSPSHATLSDVRLLRGDLGLRHLVDFRWPPRRSSTLPFVCLVGCVCVWPEGAEASGSWWTGWVCWAMARRQPASRHAAC